MLYPYLYKYLQEWSRSHKCEIRSWSCFFVQCIFLRIINTSRNRLANLAILIIERVLARQVEVIDSINKYRMIILLVVRKKTIILVSRGDRRLAIWGAKQGLSEKIVSFFLLKNKRKEPKPLNDRIVDVSIDFRSHHQFIYYILDNGILNIPTSTRISGHY